MIKPNAYLNIGKIVAMIENIDIRITNIKMFRFSK